MRQIKEAFHTIFLVILVLNLMTAGNAAANVIYVNNSDGQIADFTSIQAAVDAANPGDEIIVKPGVYVENIAINKNISIVSESGNFSDTIIRAADSSQDVFSIWANGVRIKGFGIDGSEFAGVHFFGTIDCRLENNKLSNNGCGIDLYMMSSGNTFNNNVVSDCLSGISLGDSWFNNLSSNLVSNCGSAILLFDSPNNIVENCTISENTEGISLTGESNGNSLTNNSIIFNEKFGMHIYETSNNLIYNNRFNNTVNVESEMFSDTNIWNITKIEGGSIAGGSYLGGNLWTKPDGTVCPEGIKDLDLDGIFDSQYNIEGTQFIDYLPLKESKPVTLTVNNSTGQVADFTSIQAAVDNALPGDTILIFPGIYEENVDVYVTNLTLTSELSSSEDTIVKAANSLDDVFYIIADGVTIRGLNIIGPVDFPNAGIRLNGVKYCNIQNNQLFNSYTDTIPDISSGNGSSLTLYSLNSSAGLGIRLDSSSSNILADNVLSGHTISILLRNSTENSLINNSVSGSKYGIWVDSSINNMLSENRLSNNEIGAYLKVSSGNMLNNNTALNNTGSGINLWDSVGNTLNNSTVSKNNVSIVLHGSSSNLLNNNTVSDNGYGVWLSSSSNDNKLNGNTASNNRVGIYVKGSSGNTLTDNIALNNTGPGISVWNSVENTLINNTASNNDVSIFLQDSSGNSLLNNMISSSSYGMWVASSSKNILSGNSALNNKFGLYLKNSNSNSLSGNWVNSNSIYGIYLGSSWSNVLNDNRIISNLECGLCLMDSGKSSIYNNYFSNTNNIFLKGLTAGTSLNTTRTQGKNILGESYLGGNFWARPEGDGFSQTHADNDGDGICDVAYVVNRDSIDYLPLAGSLATN